MRHVFRVCVLILFLLNAATTLSVRAASVTHNDPHGRWSILLPEAFELIDNNYIVGTKEAPGFSASSTFRAQGTGFAYVRYAECCRPDPAKLRQFAQQFFDRTKQAHPDASLGMNGIQSVLLAGQSGLFLDYFYTENGELWHGREIIAFSGGLSYDVGFISSDSVFPSEEEIAAITDSFRFTVRSVVNGIYSDPQDRFTFTAPPQYDVIPNFREEERDESLSTTTLAPNPEADEDTSAHITLYTFKESGTFDHLYDIYATKGFETLRAIPSVEGDSLSQRRISLDGHQAGVQEFIQSPKPGVLIHTFQVFAIHNDTQYVIAVALPQSDETFDASVYDGVVSSFRFPVSG